MNYEILLAYGDQLVKKGVWGVFKVTFYEGVYFFKDAGGEILFSAPADSVVCIEQV